jgi:EmrB/QacA subfamily drug resistance transporter
MTILTRTAGPARVGRVVAIVGVPMLLGPILGPILGGFLVDQVSWRWIFFINIPIGIVALVASLRVLPVDQPRPTERFDALGLIQLSPGLALVIYGLAQSSSHGGFGAPEVFIPILVGLVLLALFVRHGLRSAHPLLDLRLFGNKVFAAASATLTVFALAVFGGMLLLPLYLQAVRGESALASGLLMAPQGFGAMITMPIAGKLTDRMGVGKIVLPGMLSSSRR